MTLLRRLGNHSRKNRLYRAFRELGRAIRTITLLRYLVVKFNELLANCVIYSTACDITDAANAIAAEGHPVDTDDLATVSPYITHTIRRFGNWTLNLTPPAAAPTTRLDLEPRVLFAP